MKYLFTVNGKWQGSRNDVGSVRSKGFETAVSVDASMSGPGVGTNPDELLISATQSCYMITLAYLLSNKSLSYQYMNVHSEGVVSDEGGLHFESITHYPTIVVDKDLSEEAQEAILKAAYEAEETCMIGNAVKGRVEVSVKPHLQKSAS